MRQAMRQAAFFLPFFFGAVAGWGAGGSPAPAGVSDGGRPVASTSKYHSLDGIPFGRGVGGLGERGFGGGLAFFEGAGAGAVGFAFVAAAAVPPAGFFLAGVAAASPPPVGLAAMDANAP